MKRFIQGQDRTQSTLLPELLDEYITEDNPVRVIDVFVDQLALSELGFEGVHPAQTGRPSYHPAAMLKLYIYGYLNRIQSSRRLEAEANRNVELMWLIARLNPDFKTIARFRNENGSAIRKVCSQFVELCRRLNLFADSMVAIDGSKFKAVNSSDHNYTQAKIKSRMQAVEKNIQQYLDDLEAADIISPKQSTPHQIRLAERIAMFQAQMKVLETIEAEVQSTPDKQLSQTDPDARSMQHRGGGIVGYNVQTAVDTQHHLIVAHEVTTVGHDRTQLSNMGKQAKDVLQKETLTVVADKGYYKGEEVVACVTEGITPIMPKCLTSGNKANGLFDKRHFVYDPKSNTYQCPAGELLIERFRSLEKGRPHITYWSSSCKNCTLKSSCTTSDQRRIKRWENEAILDQMQSNLESMPEAMKIRRCTIEHTFGTLKHWMGASHFLMKTKAHVSTEMSLHILAYNMKRVISIMGSVALMKAMAA
ncbi:MAG: IS1182 family transposase [Hydrogenophaga sp.]|jgi:transposase|uniref:IS1182 family transposase n=1 Tax=Methylotenera mobilis TaxID=359408 RepID=UPI000382617C|nr:IS1182 family transposase [Methylotenera mobilis]MDD2934014.1 IS1182 family transposase [Methylotenera sp.]MDP3322097.1 IS1182 family transposase [Hydrogenophaga sp.]PKO47587.1 MAG: IS1182 family transposase [Betaproteobacteria bacterium HGW-Betaproteobacteria-22]MDD4927127.1 IS1182 family transposase [Methylotenera sp.]MDO9233592.1 IS1182 family transposase [Methylotenera sp.]